MKPLSILFLLIKIILFCFGMVSSSSTPSVPVHDIQIDLPTGIKAQVVYSIPDDKPTESRFPLVLFLHGSFHGPWCWQEHFFPYFVERGYPVLAYAWRGTSGTFAGKGVKKVKAEEHVDDLKGLLELLPKIMEYPQERKVIVVCHSFGGILFLKYLESLASTQQRTADKFAGIVMMNPVPPSGYGQMTKRVLWRSWSDTWKIVRGIPMKRAVTDAKLCRDLFFGGRVVDQNGSVDNCGVLVSDQDLARYQGHFAQDSTVTIDTTDLAKNLPSKIADSKGQAPFVSELPPVLVMGATRDIIVDHDALIETATYLGATKDALLVVEGGHDSMLGRNGPKTAGLICSWIQETIVC